MYTQNSLQVCTLLVLLSLALEKTGPNVILYVPGRYQGSTMYLLSLGDIIEAQAGRSQIQVGGNNAGGLL